MRRLRPSYRYRMGNILRNFLRRVRKNFSFSLLLIIIFVLGFLLFIYGLRNNIYSSQHYVSKILYTSGSFQHYSDPELYAAIGEMYSGTYYTALRMFRETNMSLDAVKQKYPFIQDVRIENYANNTLLLHVEFIKPALRFRYKDSIYAIYENYALHIGSGEILGNGTPLVLLPIYLSGSSESISGVLYGIDAKKILYDYLLLKTSPIHGSITYIPGGDKYILWNEKLRIYFNAKKDLNKQLLTLYVLMNNYQPFPNLEQIDLGSIDNPIVR